jgi:hypothetical protein
MKTIILKRILILIIPVFLFLGGYQAKADTYMVNCEGGGYTEVSFSTDKGTYNIGDTIYGYVNQDDMIDPYNPGCSGTLVGSSIYSTGGNVQFEAIANNPTFYNIVGGTVGGIAGMWASLTFGQIWVDLNTEFYISSAVLACGVCYGQSYYPFDLSWTWPKPTATSTCLVTSPNTTCTPEIPLFGEAIGSPVQVPNSECGFPQLSVCTATSTGINVNPVVNVR